VEGRIALASALAGQWFGAFLVPEAPHDEWLIEGLRCHLTDLFVRSMLGPSELSWRR
jgi:hypothetical protein